MSLSLKRRIRIDRAGIIAMYDCKHWRSRVMA